MTDSDQYTAQMYEDVLAWWIEALESGEYPQTDGTMCRLDTTTGSPVGYCCLGVLCELAIQHGVSLTVDDELNGRRKYDNECGSYLPDAVVQWAGFKEGRTLLYLGRTTAAERNDAGEIFPVIAKHLRFYVQPIAR